MRRLLGGLCWWIFSIVSVGQEVRGAQIPSLVDTLGSPVEQTDVVFSPDLRPVAPIVIVGLVRENQIVQTRPAARMPEVLLDLHKLRISIELSIRGNLDSSELEAYYFTQSAESSRPNPRYVRLYDARPGQQYVFFLCQENGIIRSVGDVGEYSVPVFSGLHRSYTSTTDFGRTLADILLTPGDGMNPERFARGLRDSSVVADRWGSRSYDVRLLRKLLLETGAIRDAACRALTSRYNGQHDCEYDVDRSVGSEHDFSMKRYLQDGRDADLLQALRSLKGLNFPIIGHPDSRKRATDELQSILESPNLALRRASCAALNRYYPESAESCAP